MMVDATGSPLPGPTAAADTQAALAASVDQTAVLLGIPVSAASRAGVIAAFTAYSDAAALLMAFPLPGEVEQAAVYTLGYAGDDR